MAKREGNEEKIDYELMPEKRFEKLESQVNEILKNPLVRKETAHEFHEALLSTNKSIKSLAEVLQTISENASLDEKEEEYVKNQLKPLILAIKEVKEQNETIATGMVNIIDRLNDLQKEITGLRQIRVQTKTQEYYPSSQVEQENQNLPPLEGGPIPPETEMGTDNFQGTQVDFMPDPINAQPLDGIPPMEKNGMTKRFKLF